MKRSISYSLAIAATAAVIGFGVGLSESKADGTGQGTGAKCPNVEADKIYAKEVEACKGKSDEADCVAKAAKKRDDAKKLID